MLLIGRIQPSTHWSDAGCIRWIGAAGWKHPWAMMTDIRRNALRLLRPTVWVNGNWRVTFEFKDGHAYVLDYEDYH